MKAQDPRCTLIRHEADDGSGMGVSATRSLLQLLSSDRLRNGAPVHDDRAGQHVVQASPPVGEQSQDQEQAGCDGEQEAEQTSYKRLDGKESVSTCRSRWWLND